MPDPAPPVSATSATSASRPLTNAQILRRLFGLAWQYRHDCLAVLAHQAALLALGLAGLGVVGLAVDVIRSALDPSAAPPPWPLGLRLPVQFGPMPTVLILAALVLAMAGLRSVVNFRYSVAVGRLLQADVVPRLRGEVFDKLQRLDFRFFDSNASGSIINRVTGDVQSLRSFIDGVLIQSVILMLSLAVYLVYMVGKHLPLTAGLPGLDAAAVAGHDAVLALGAAGLRREPPAGRQPGAGAVRGRAGHPGGARLRRRAARTGAVPVAQPAAARPAAPHLPAGQPVLARGQPGGAAEHRGAAVLRRLDRARRRAVAGRPDRVRWTACSSSRAR